MQDFSKSMVNQELMVDQDRNGHQSNQRVNKPKITKEVRFSPEVALIHQEHPQSEENDQNNK